MPIWTTRGCARHFSISRSGAGDVVGVHPDRAAELITELAVLQPLRHHHLVVRGVQRAAQVPVRHDAARHRVQDRHVDSALRKQLVGNEFRIRARVLAVRPLGVGRVLAARRPVPVHLVVGETATLERLAQRPAQLLVGREEDVHARIDQRRARPVRVFYHLNHPSRLRRSDRACWPYDRQSNIPIHRQSTGFR